MSIVARLSDLAVMHPRLLWDDIGAAAAAILGARGRPPYLIEIAVRDVPGFAANSLRLAIDSADVDAAQVRAVQRTYEPSRLVELAGIAIAGLALYYAGGHEIRDVALRGSTADYLVDDGHYLLEIAGRSRRSDLNPAWQQRWKRLADSGSTGCYVCVVEFETPSAVLEFRE